MLSENKILFQNGFQYNSTQNNKFAVYVSKNTIKSYCYITGGTTDYLSTSATKVKVYGHA